MVGSSRARLGAARYSEQHACWTVLVLSCACARRRASIACAVVGELEALPAWQRKEKRMQQLYSRYRERHPLIPLELQPARHPNLELARRERDLLKEQLKGSPLKSGKVKQAEAALEERSRRQQALMDVATPAMGWAMQEGSAASTPPPPAAAATLQTSCCRRWKCCLQRQRHYTTTTADHYE